MVFRDDQPLLITHISSGATSVVRGRHVDKDDGTEEEKGICGHSITPEVCHLQPSVRRLAGRRARSHVEPRLFQLRHRRARGRNPKYSASHGCVRIPMHIGNYFPSLVTKGDQIFVFDVKELEAYGAQVLPFNTPDPSFTTTTSSTTTTTTTLPPATQPPATQADPASTTADPRAHGDAHHGGSGRGAHLDALTPTAHRRSR